MMQELETLQDEKEVIELELRSTLVNLAESRHASQHAIMTVK